MKNKWIEEHRSEWNEYMRNYARAKYNGERYSKRKKQEQELKQLQELESQLAEKSASDCN